MDEHDDRPSMLKTVGFYFSTTWHKVREARPVGFYLLIAILLVVIVGWPGVTFRENPKRFVLFLIVNIVFFAFVILRALIDLFEIGKRHIKEREQIFGQTLGDSDFASKLGHCVKEKHKE